MSTHVEQSITVDVPVETAYNQWTQFEDFPLFMEDVETVEQIDDSTLHWKTRIRGVEREWNAEITEQTPNQRVAWHSEDGPDHAGVVTFHKLDDATTKVMLQMEFEPSGFAEKYADAVGLVEKRTMNDLEGFKKFIETRGQETGAWRGNIDAS